MQIWDPVCKGKGLGSIHFQIDDVIKSRSSPTSVGPLRCHSVTFASTFFRVRERTRDTARQRVFQAYSNAWSPERVKLIYAQLHRGLLI